MRLVRLVYASTFQSDEVDVSELKKIHEVAMENNSKTEITGMLILGNDYFLQCLEGERESVNRLYEKISQDKRHKRALLLRYEECQIRKFASWAMKFMMLTKDQQEIIKKYSVSTNFNPYEMSGESCLEFLSELDGSYS